VPEKFRGSDEAATLDKMLKALQDAETALTQSNQERSQLQNIVQDLSKRPREEFRPQTQTTQTAATVVKKEESEEEIDDATFFDKPVELSRKIAAQVAREIAREEATKTVQHYDTFATRRSVLERFKETHPDFDNFRSEVVEVCRMHPEWDNDLNGLPKIYEAAKTLAIAKAKAVSTSSPQVNINVEELKAQIKAEVEAEAFNKAKQAIIDEVKKRKAASGILSSTNTATSSDRASSGSKTTEMSPEDKILDEMLKSGPKSLGI
jgi:Holliday junction resolvase RusA-like endonuclease